MKSRQRLLFLCLAILSVLCQTTPVCARVNTWSSLHSASFLNMQEGLPHNYIDDLKKDSRGFIWAATAGGGLVRYDGYGFTEFGWDHPTHKVKSNLVRTLCEDSQGKLWVGTRNGVDVIDIYSLESVSPDDTNPLFREDCHKLFRSSDGRMWLSTESGCYRLGKTSEEPADTLIRHTDGHRVNCFAEYDGKVFLGYGNRVLQTSTDSVDVKELFISSIGNQVNALKEWQGKLWIGTGWGLFCYNFNGQTIKEYHTGREPNSLSQDYITDLALSTTKGDTCLIASTLRGFNVYRPTTDDFEQITCENTAVRPLLNCNFINCLLADGDKLWIGTEAGGISLIRECTLFVKNYSLKDGQKDGIAPHPINAIHQEKDGSLWIGSVEGGVFRMNPTTEKIEHYQTDTSYLTGLSHNSVCCFSNDGDGRLWAGTWGGGICVSTEAPSSDSTPRFVHLCPSEFPELHWALIRFLCYDSINHYMWTATADALYAYDFKRKRFIIPISPNEIGGMLVGNTGSCIDNKNRMWINTLSGLCCIGLQSVLEGSPKYELWPTLWNEVNMTETKVTFMTTSSDGSIWASTDGYGVIHITEGKDGHIFERLSTENGLISNHARGILEAVDRTIWISTLKGISRYNPQTGNCTNYTVADGLPDSPFYVNGACKESDSILYFGSMQGVTAVSTVKTSVHDNDSASRLAFTDVHTLERSLPLHEGTVNIHEKEKSITVQFASLTYCTQPAESYEYRLHGFDEKDAWHPAPDRKAVYTNLQGGEYVLEVRHSTNGSQWNDDTARLIIRVESYFYKTVWFRLALIVTVVLLLYGIYKWRIRNLKRQKAILHKKVQEHTFTLQNQKKELAEYARELEEKNQLLTAQNEEITQQKKEILQMAQQQFAYSMSPDELHIPTESPDAELLNRTLAIIKENYTDPNFEINDLISALGISRTMLYTKIQKLTGDSVGSLLRNYRLTMAHRLIAETLPAQSLTIAEIAYRVGFNDPKYFTRCFAKQFGCPPSKVLEKSDKDD